MPSLTQTRDAAVALLKAALPGVQRVIPFAGELALDSLAQKNVPVGDSLFVAVLGAMNAGQGLDCDMRAAFCCFCLSRKTGKEDREADALALAERVATVLHGATFGLSGLSPARVMSLSAMPDEDIGKSGVNVWAVTFEQHITFDGEGNGKES